MKSRKTRTLVALGGVVISGFLLMATSFAEDKKEIKLDFENAIQTIPEIIFKPSLRDTNHVELKNEIGTKLIRIITNGNSFLLKKHGEGSSVEGSGSTVLGGVSNNVDNSHYSTIVAGSNNQISNSTHATIGGGSGNRVSGDYGTVAGGENNVAQKYSAVVGGKDNVAGGDYSVVLGNSNETHGSYSVAMGSDAIVNGDRSFLWNDGSAEKTLVGNDMFAVNGASGMVVNATKAHRFAQLTIGGSLSINDSNAAVECKPGVLKVVNRTDVANQVCFCSCDGTKWNSLFGGGKCNRICDSTSPEVSCDNNSATKICEGSNISYSGGCLVGEVVQGTGAFLVDNKGELHWTCQTRDGSQEQCHGKIKTTKGTCNDPKGTFVCTGKPNHAEFLPGTDSGLTDNTGPTLYNTRAEAQADTTKKCRWYCEDGYYLEGDYCLKKKPCNGCPSGEVESGLTCESYSEGSVTSPENCPEKVISTCDNGTWDVAPGNYLSCTKYYRSCTSSACGTKSDGASCTTYDRCSSTPITSVCNDGTWSRTPGAYSSPNQGCNGCSSSACGSRTNGQSCTTYDRCSSTAITSVCNDGTWSRTPGAYSSPNQGCNGCPASGGCPATSNGQSCTSYAKCSTTSKTSTCIDGSWSSTPYGYSSPNQGCSGCDGCPTGAVSNGGTCTSYAKCSSTAIISTCSNGTWSTTPGAYSSPNQGCDNLSCTGCPGKSSVSHGGTCTSYARCSSTAITSVCNDGTWSRTPGAYSSPNQGSCTPQEYPCGGDAPEIGGDGVLAGDVGYQGSHTPTNWTYVDYDEYYGSACTWTCGEGHVKAGNGCAESVDDSCSAETYTYGDCSYSIPALSDGGSQTVSTSTSSRNGSVKVTCSDGTLSYSNKSCKKSTSCGTAPTNSSWVVSTYAQSWNGSAWSPSSKSKTCVTSSSSTTECSFKCNNGKVCNGNSGCKDPDPTDCSSTTYTYGSCSYSIPALSHGGSQAVSTSTNGYNGSVTASCSNGTLSYSSKSCTEKSCESTTYTYGSCSYSIPALSHGGSQAVSTSTKGYNGSVTASCNKGTLSYSSKSCEEVPKGCSSTTRTKGSCTFSIPALSDGDSTTKTYTTSPYYGSTTAKCTNGTLSYSSESCITVCNSSTNPGSCNGSFSPTYPGSTWGSSYIYTCKYGTLSYSCSATCPTGKYWMGSQCDYTTTICGSTHNNCISPASFVSGSAGSKSSSNTTTYTWKCKRGDYTESCTETVTEQPKCTGSIPDYGIANNSKTPSTNTQWYHQEASTLACTYSCIGQSYWNGTTCLCSDETKRRCVSGQGAPGDWDGDRCECYCPQGTTYNERDGTCDCPSGKYWNGTECTTSSSDDDRAGQNCEIIIPASAVQSYQCPIGVYECSCNQSTCCCDHYTDYCS